MSDVISMNLFCFSAASSLLFSRFCMMFSLKNLGLTVLMIYKHYCLETLTLKRYYLLIALWSLLYPGRYF